MSKKKPVPVIKVMIAACGMLRDNELQRQHKAGIVKNFGEMKLEGVLLKPDKVTEVPQTPVVVKAIEDGIIICVGGC